jgi:hypothetical protein
MGLVRNRQPQVEQRSVNYGDPSFVAPYPGWMNQAQNVGIPVNQTTVRSLEVVQMALDIIRDGVISRGPLMAYTTEMSGSVPYRKWSPNQPSVLSDLFYYDGPLTNGPSRGLTETVMSMALFAGAWWHILGRDANGDANFVQTLFPPLMDIRVVNGVREWWYGLGVDKVQMDPSMLVYIPYKSLPGHQRGMSSIEDAAPIYALSLAAMQFGEMWFAQGSQTSMMLSAKGELSESGAKRIAQQFASRHAGIQNAHIPLVVDQDMTATPMASNPDESQMTATLSYARAAVASMMHLPFFMVDPIKGAPFSTYEEVAALMEDTLFKGYIIPIQDAASHVLRSGLKTAFLSDLERPNSMNIAAKITAVKTADLMTPNEMRTLWLGLPPSDSPVADELGNPSPFNVAAGEGQSVQTQAEGAAKTTEQSITDDQN